MPRAPAAAQSMVSASSISRLPKSPGSRQSISPPAAVLASAPAKVRQGAERLQGLASSPTPETQVRVACAAAGVAAANKLDATAIAAKTREIMNSPPHAKRSNHAPRLAPEYQ